MNHLLVKLLLSMAFLGGALATEPAAWMPRVEDETQLWWEEGSPKVMNSPTPPTRETLCFQQGGKRMLFDTKLVRPVEGAWECVLVNKGQRFTCKGHRVVKDAFFEPVRFVECGRFFHRVIIEDLIFADDAGKEFEGRTRLEISMWPDRLAFRLECDGDAALELAYAGKRSTGTKSVLVEVSENTALAKVESELPVTRDEALGCHRLPLPEKNWSNKGGTYYPEEHLDRVDRWRVTLTNETDAPAVARLMFTQERHLPITGFTPMLCELDGTPTGLPVQISKNWHRSPEKGDITHQGTWFHGFALVRVPPKSTRELMLQMVYARYGGVFAVSHSQLSLIGWGHNQFWDQVAVGSFGESICFEPGRVQRRCFITDVRPLLTLSREPNPKPYGWAENCGGGDFMLWMGPDGRYRAMKATRTDYRAYGPCLTNVGYREETTGGEISAEMDVSVPAANDHLRTFFNLRYAVKQPVRRKRLAFFQLGADYYNSVPARRVAVGDHSGLREEWEPRRAKDEYDRAVVPLTGDVAWVSIHGVERDALTKGHAAAGRGFIIRKWKAVLGGKPAQPHVALFCTEWGKGNHRTAVELAPPPDVSELLPGDFIEVELEMVVLPADAAAYYGPDAAFRARLSRDADTWRLVHGEAVGNALKPMVMVGTVTKPYPLVIAVNDAQQAKVKLTSGVGNIPVTLTGLTRPKGYKLQVNGRAVEAWQTDWNAALQKWSISFNLPSVAESGAEITLE